MRTLLLLHPEGCALTWQPLPAKPTISHRKSYLFFHGCDVMQSQLRTVRTLSCNFKILLHSIQLHKVNGNIRIPSGMYTDTLILISRKHVSVRKVWDCDAIMREKPKECISFVSTSQQCVSVFV